MRIDAHQHFWLMRNRQGQWPPPELAVIHRDFEPRDLAPMLGASEVQGTVLVQSLPRDADTDYLLEVAERTGFVRGVVGWVDLKRSDAPVRLARLGAHSLFKGVRPMLQDIADPDWIDDDERLRPAIEALCSLRLTFDALVLPHHLAPLLRFASRHPALRIVIDHGAKPCIGVGRFVSWRRAMAALAALPHVHCKLSGLLTEAGAQRPEAIRPYAETLLDLFGPQRVLWGSDWPVLGLVSDYGAWLSQCLDIVPPPDHAAVFGDNATTFYDLDTDRDR